ncbi:hypothetical protein GCM10022200_03920 [Microbacterium awajiense]|uniref:PH domain-containing protein n=1 Tax=Microbacterium awajiense TaxID=415214 RepID=A0ABP7A4T2_9MICO
MTREGALVVMVLVTFVILGLLAWAWIRRTRRDAGPFAPTGDLPGGADVLAVFDGLYVATTRHDLPLERIAAPGMAFRSRATITVADVGVALDLPGQDRIVIPRDRIVGVGQSTVAIDRVVEQDGLTRLEWRALTDQVVDTYLRPQDASARALADAISGILPTPSGADV